jgi:hypothetical protein
LISIYQAVKEGLFKKAEPTGSKYICNPPVEDTDEDWIVLVDNLNTTYEHLDREGFVIGGSFWVDGKDGGNTNNNYWWSFKKDNLNLIVTDCETFFNDFVLATYVSKKLNLLSKPDRITVFQAILYGNKR